VSDVSEHFPVLSSFNHEKTVSKDTSVICFSFF
jgi:hypothetical protein